MAHFRQEKNIGHWAFLIGIVLALIAGFVPQLQTPRVSWMLVLLGLIVGLLNIKQKETHSFLLAGVALLLAANSATSILKLGWLVFVLENVVTFLFPAVFVVAFKTVWQLASDQ
ncbi:MAG TPA: hypothetical protein VJJ82_02765 [Candidatus Nanoarchaeia archaeon]|nr:hypothetical protein [Candidatus Nanoarchaeia archaeon]